ncbi:unnamed protein product, partial [Closterium sp. NIES-53]
QRLVTLASPCRPHHSPANHVPPNNHHPHPPARVAVSPLYSHTERAASCHKPRRTDPSFRSHTGDHH